MTMKNIFLITLLLYNVFSSHLSAKVWINELMQSNINLVQADFQYSDNTWARDFPDSWIELYNDSDEPVDIQNWTISLEANYRNGWKMVTNKQPIIIAPKSYLLIYADEAATGIHANFRVDSSGCTLYLFDSSGQQIDMAVIPKHPAPNVAFGRLQDGKVGMGWGWIVSPTPETSNQGTTTYAKTSKILLPAPVFSRVGGVFKNNVKVSLSLPEGTPAGVTLSNIHYTLDNTEPTVNSLVYTGELTINTPTVVRAKLIHPDYLTNWSTVHSYIVSSKNHSLPVISISTDPSYLWDDEFGIYCDGNGKYGKTGNSVDYKVNWNNEWRRPINFEYFPEENSPSVINQLGEFRIASGWSRANPQKTFIAYSNKRFGPNKRYVYDFFKEKPGMEIKSFMIRNSGNDFNTTHFRDAAIQLFLGGKVDIDYQAYQPAIFYLNGEYWGVQNLRERSNEDWVLSNRATEDIDMFENWWDLKAGDWNNLNLLMNELRKSSSQRNYELIMSQVDLDEFINYMILQIYISNTDFPGNNTAMWRLRHTNGKWRFLLKDTDHGLGIWGFNPVTHNTLIWNTQSNDDPRKLFNALLTQDSFKKNFYKRFAVYMGDILHYNSTSQVIDSIQAIIEPAMQDHFGRWGSNMDSWYWEIDKMKTWCNRRNVEVYKHLKNYFKLGEIMSLTYETASNLSETPAVYINDVRMRKSGLKGSYFQKEPIELRYDGNAVNYVWEITKTVGGATTTEKYYQQEVSYMIADRCTSVKIKLVDNPNSLTNPVTQEIGLSVSENQLQISDLQLPSVVSIYDITGKLIAKKTISNSSLTIPLNQKGVFIVEVQNDAQRLTQKVTL